MSLEQAGEKIDEITVQISYKIIELFSAGLYSSPNKAFEELVSNSYDAIAKNVGVFVPSDIQESSNIWICDDGLSMNLEGLKQLWRIGYSAKRRKEKKLERLQIGKFGIGKLSTYVLAEKLTYVCKTEDEFLAVTMDYSSISQDGLDISADEEIKLDVRKLTEKEAKAEIEPYLNYEDKFLLDFQLFGKDAVETWTFSLMSNLKEKATEISEGVLKWVLRTALPLNPNFKLTFNGVKIKSSKIDANLLNKWVIGENDKIAEKYFEVNEVEGTPVVNFENLKEVHGEILLYEDSLLGGKSANFGRSNGIFLLVRGRLVNPKDSLLGMDAFTHGVFNRTRIEIHADGLDEYLTSTRESVKDSKAFSQLKDYIKKKFNSEVREYYSEYQEKVAKEKSASEKVSSSPTSLSRRPLLSVARKYYQGEISSPYTISLRDDLDEDEEIKFLEELESDLTSDQGIIKEVTWESLGPEFPLANLDLYERIARVNFMHPFFANYSEDVKSVLPFKLVAITEILTEAQLVELGINQDFIKNIMTRRDRTLRQLTYSERPNAPLVASMINSSLADSVGLEVALFNAFKSLGFETNKLGKKGEPDGKAVAILGTREKLNANYSFVYDAKSTGKKRISAGTIKSSASVRHRKKFKADYSLVVARDFEGAEDPNSAASVEARQQNVTLIRAKDLMRLVLYSAPKRVGLDELKDLFENCNTVLETSAWIEKLKNKEIDRGPIKEMLETVYKLQKEDEEAPEIASVRVSHEKLKTYSKEYLRDLVFSLERIVPGLISLDGEVISLNNPPDKVLKAVHGTIETDLPIEFSKLYIESYEE